MAALGLTGMDDHEITTSAAWLQARRALMAEERALMQHHDRVAQMRRALPWVRVDAEYTFDGPSGPCTLPALFAGRRQLVLYHFMFRVDAELGCKSCSFWADHFDAMTPHLAARDVSLAVVSHAERERLIPFQQRMGWRFPWYSSFGSAFNFDFGVSFTAPQLERGDRLYNFGTAVQDTPEKHGVSVFYKDERGDVFHTYSTFARGAEVVNNTYHVLDLVPKGRDESGLTYTMAWVRYHDEYEP